MTECAVPSCSRDSISHPNATFFSLPHDSNVKSEWLEILGLNQRYGWSDETKICETHFRAEDLCADRKQLKAEAIPINPDFIEGDSLENDTDIIIHCDSASGAVEIIDSRAESKSQNENSKKSEPMADLEGTKHEVEEMQDTIGSRRPSRRAAQLAARKITDSVRSCNVLRPLSTQTGMKASALQSQHAITNKAKLRRSIKEWHALKIPPEEIGVLLECHEELLSIVQKEAFSKATKEYNIAESAIKILKSMNVRIIKMKQVDHNVPVVNPISIINEYSSKNSSAHNSHFMQKQNSITMIPIESSNSNSIKIFPIKLSPTNVSVNSPSPILS